MTYIGRDNKPLDSRLPAYDPNKGGAKGKNISTNCRLFAPGAGPENTASDRRLFSCKFYVGSSGQRTLFCYRIVGLERGRNVIVDGKVTR